VAVSSPSQDILFLRSCSGSSTCASKREVRNFSFRRSRRICSARIYVKRNSLYALPFAALRFAQGRPPRRARRLLQRAFNPLSLNVPLSLSVYITLLYKERGKKNKIFSKSIKRQILGGGKICLFAQLSTFKNQKSNEILRSFNKGGRKNEKSKDIKGQKAKYLLPLQRALNHQNQRVKHFLLAFQINNHLLYRTQ